MTSVLALTLALALCAAGDAEKALDCAEKAGAGLKTYRARYEQRRTYKYFPDDAETTAGTLLYRKPSMVLRLETPVAKTIWADRDRVDIYTPGTKQLERWTRAEGKGDAGSPVPLTLNRAELEASYVITLASATEDAWTLLLVPRPGTEAAKSFLSRSITLRRADCLPVRYEFVEAAGDKVSIELGAPAVNGEIKDAEMERRFPADAEVIPLNDAPVR